MTVSAPTLQLLTWLGERERTYAETVDVWRSSCPRLMVWEDAVADGLVKVVDSRVVVTPRGENFRGQTPNGV
jgi:hypothetical protein